MPHLKMFLQHYLLTTFEKDVWDCRLDLKCIQRFINNKKIITICIWQNATGFRIYIIAQPMICEEIKAQTCQYQPFHSNPTDHQLIWKATPLSSPFFWEWARSRPPSSCRSRPCSSCSCPAASESGLRSPAQTWSDHNSDDYHGQN